MSGALIIGEMLGQSAGLMAVVPSDNLALGGLPQGTPVPALIVTSISDVSTYGVAGRAQSMTERVQVTILSKHPEQQIDLLKLVLDACDGVTGTVAGFSGVDVTSAGKGADFRDDADVWITSRDFKVTFRP